MDGLLFVVTRSSAERVCACVCAGSWHVGMLRSIWFAVKNAALEMLL